MCLHKKKKVCDFSTSFVILYIDEPIKKKKPEQMILLKTKKTGSWPGLKVKKSSSINFVHLLKKKMSVRTMYLINFVF